MKKLGTIKRFYGIKKYNCGKNFYLYIYQFDKYKIIFANSNIAYLINDSLINTLIDER